MAVLDMDMSGAETTCHAIRLLGVTATPYKVCALSKIRFIWIIFSFSFRANRSMLGTMIKWLLSRSLSTVTWVPSIYL